MPDSTTIKTSSAMSGTYDPQTFKPLTYHDAIPAFLEGRDSPRAYLERCLATIEEREPTVKAWVSMNIEGARRAADEATSRYKAGQPLSTIDGMPIGIKDLLQTRDLPTELGTPLFKGNQTRQDSASIQALRWAGAVILGKTVTTELGFSHPGPTTNPFDSRRTPGGSSSGSAAAVGASMVPATLGTQVVGSLIRPSGYCANTALKPTLGALHRGERLGLSQSHIGVHAGCLVDMWHVAVEIAKRIGGDPGYPGLFGGNEPAPATRPQRLIVMETEGWPTVDAKTMHAFEMLLDLLRENGVTILRRGDHPLIGAFESAIGDSMAMCRDLCGYEMRWTLENIVDRFPTGLSESMYNRLLLAREMTLADYRMLLVRREEARRRLAAIAPLADALISLSSNGPAPLLGDATGSDQGIAHTTGQPVFNAPTSILGSPTLSLPLIAVEGMPVGVQIVGQQHADERLTGTAQWMIDTLDPVVVH